MTRKAAEQFCRLGLDWVGLGWVGLGWVGLGWVELGRSCFPPTHTVGDSCKYPPARVPGESYCSVLFEARIGQGACNVI